MSLYQNNPSYGVEHLFESFRTIVKNFGNSNDTKEFKKMEVEKYNQIKQEFEKDCLSPKEMKSFFYQKAIEGYDFSTELKKQALEKLNG